MSILDDLRGLSSAEDFFAYLDVPFERRVVDVARLHILRRMAEYLAKDSLEGMDDATAREHCRAHLSAAYADFVAKSPIDERIFAVHKNAVRDKGRGRSPLVTLDVRPARGRG